MIRIQAVLEDEAVGLNLIPGIKLCLTCQSRVIILLLKSSSRNENDEDFDIVNESSTQNKKEDVDLYFTASGISPIISLVKLEKVNENCIKSLH